MPAGNNRVDTHRKTLITSRNIQQFLLLLVLAALTWLCGRWALRQIQFSSNQFCHVLHLSSFWWLSCLGWHSPSISASEIGNNANLKGIACLSIPRCDGCIYPTCIISVDILSILFYSLSCVITRQQNVCWITSGRSDVSMFLVCFNTVCVIAPGSLASITDRS